jgi:hypothetical protein
VIQAFLDESGTDERWPCVCVGAYAAEEIEWKLFADEFIPVLRHHGIGLFHAKETRCDRLRPALAAALEKRNVYGYMFSVAKRDYKELAIGRIRQQLGNPYAQGAIGCALKIARQAREQQLGPVAFFIESGQPNAEFVRQSIEVQRGNDYFAIASAEIVQKGDHVALQAADFLAHVAGTHQVQWLERLIGDGPGKALHCHFDHDAIVSMTHQVEDVWKRYRRMQAAEKRAARLTAK